jgi:hypothetical protein
MIFFTFCLAHILKKIDREKYNKIVNKKVNKKKRTIMRVVVPTEQVARAFLRIKQQASVKIYTRTHIIHF